MPFISIVSLGLTIQLNFSVTLVFCGTICCLASPNRIIQFLLLLVHFLQFFDQFATQWLSRLIMGRNSLQDMFKTSKTERIVTAPKAEG